MRTHLARATGLGATVCLCVVLALSAQAPTAQLELPGYFRYSPAQLRAYQQSLRPRMNQLKQAAEADDFWQSPGVDRSSRGQRPRGNSRNVD